jgi:poly(3-hydroxybutyrate) depolymerase
MKKPITASLAAVALVASLASVAAAAPTAAPVTPSVQENHETSGVAMSRIATPKPTSTDESGIDRTFHPDTSHALTVDQTTAAWNAEIDRVFETPTTGGG